MPKRKTSSLAILLAVIASAISGINTPVIHYALGTIPTPLFGFLRMAIPLLVLTPLMLISKRNRPKTKHILLAMTYGMLVYFASNGLFYLGISRSGAINAAIIWLLSPLLMFSFSVEVMGEKFSPRVLIGIFIAFAGSMLVVFGPMLGHQKFALTGSIAGNLLLVGCVFCSVGGNWVAKSTLKHVDRLQLLFWALVPATLIFGMLSFKNWDQIPGIFQNPGTRYAVLFGALMNGLVAYAFSFYALKRLRGEEFGIFDYVDPAVAAVVAVVFFRQTFTPLLLGGVFVIFVGLYLAEAHRHRALNVHWLRRH